MATKVRGAINAAHTAGIFADMTLDGPEIGTLVAVVDRARNLPNRKTMGKQDPYCAMRLGKEAKKTDTDKRGGQTPKWDQELRFVVHESQDYYKLKCSIFNDDKKTDLIGEAWIDLQEVIVPGGGQNDLWHQLNFKGKYAGDVRIELTFYDSRPKPETPSEKKKREKSHSMASDATTSTVTGSRHLGPRELKRRPLPPGPGGYSSPVSTQHTPEPRPSTSSQNDYAPETWINRQQNNTNPPPRPPKQPIMPETPDDVGYDLANPYTNDLPAHPFDSSYDQRAPSREGGLSHQINQLDQRHSSHDYYHDYVEDEPQPSIADQYTPNTYQPYQGEYSVYSHRTSRSRDHFEPSTPAQAPRPIPNSSPLHSSPPVQYPSQPAHMASSQSQQPTWQSRGSPSPTKHTVYRDSPLRQSISQREMPSEHQDYGQQQFEDDEPPPPPPAHGSQLVKMPMPQNFQSSVNGYTPTRTPVKQGSIEDRSPLQRLEYEHYQGSAYSTQDTPSPSHSYDLDAGHGYVPYSPRAEERRNSYNDARETMQSRSSGNKMMGYNQESPYDIAQPRYSTSPKDEFHRSPGHGRSEGHRNSYGPPQRAQTFDNYEISDERFSRRSEPVVVRPRAISPNPAHTIPRKSITPTPDTLDRRSDIGSTPFSPDSYDVLNPGTSPSAEIDPFATPEQAKEAARQNEADMGPIIGNDGRVIDPSDHLPANTWAPEPERKNRKPEHVIRIRTREEARMHIRTGSSPASARPHSIATSPYQPSPDVGPSSPYQAGPTLPPKIPPSPQAESPTGRNRLRKAMPNRPLPTQPYTHAQTSPAVMTTSSIAERPSPTMQRYSIGSSPTNGHVQRPPLSEYQTPAGSSYNSRVVPTRPDYSTSPSSTKAPYPPPPSVADYGGYGTDDSLALELSTIDIGPSRGARTAVRSSRGFGGY